MAFTRLWGHEGEGEVGCPRGRSEGLRACRHNMVTDTGEAGRRGMTPPPEVTEQPRRDRSFRSLWGRGLVQGAFALQTGREKARHPGAKK